MNKLSELVNALPEMKSGTELIQALAVLPEYDADIRRQNQAVRLMALSDLYQIYIPSQMSLEIYSKLYLALLRSLQKKGTKLAVKQQYENVKAIQNREYAGIIGGSDSFTIIGASGIGKSTAIARAIHLVAGSNVIECDEPYCKVLPCIVVQCPFDSSVKGLLFEILRKVDEVLDSKYYLNAVKARATTDMLIGSVSQVALNHIGLLVVDEIQNVVNSKNGKALVGMLTQLINNSGISICMVGTPESTVFFSQAMQLARRSLGLQYGALEYGADFKEICRILFQYLFTKEDAELTDAMLEWLYEHSGGNISILVSIIHDAQEIAILTGIESLNTITLSEAYENRMTLLHGYIEPSIKKGKQSSQTKRARSIPIVEQEAVEKDSTVSIIDMVSMAKNTGKDIVELMKQYLTIEEVAV